MLPLNNHFFIRFQSLIYESQDLGKRIKTIAPRKRSKKRMGFLFFDPRKKAFNSRFLRLLLFYYDQ
jgi:hypothetical protein